MTEGEKAELHIGDRVPIPTTSFNTSNTVGGSIVPVTSFTYQNTGIQITIEPRVHHNKEITLKMNLELSSVSGSVQSAGGLSQPIIGTRQIQTVVRLKDGETNLLSGLISEDDVSGYSGIPGIASIPGLRNVLGNTNTTKKRLDIVLSITPHIVRVPDITAEDMEAIWVGTEENTRLRSTKQSAFGETPFGGTTEEVPPPGPVTTTPPPPAPRPAPAPAPQPEVRKPVPPPPEPEAEQDEVGDETGDEGFPEEPPPQGGGSTTNADKTPPPVTSIAQVILSAPKSVYRVGETVYVQVQISGAQNVGSVPFHLRFNPQVFTFVAPALEGDFLGSDGSQTIFASSEIQGGGEIVVGLSRTGAGTGASGAGLLATFQFSARAPGTGSFSFSGASVRDPAAANLPCSFNTATITVQAAG